MTIDLGTGDGRAVLARAAAEPSTLAIGIDANAASMIESSRRAAKPERKGGRPNALFVVAAAEAPPPELAGLADELTITLPWGSLLDGVLGRDDRVAAGVASLVAPGGRLRSIVSTAACDGRDLPVLDDSLASAIARAWAGHGLTLEAFRPASAAELAAHALDVVPPPGPRGRWCGAARPTAVAPRAPAAAFRPLAHVSRLGVLSRALAGQKGARQGHPARVESTNRARIEALTWGSAGHDGLITGDRRSLSPRYDWESWRDG